MTKQRLQVHANAGCRKGFTLVEIMIVMAIIATLASLLIPAISVALRKKNVALSEVRIDNLKHAIEIYMAENTSFGETDTAGNVLSPLRHLYHDLNEGYRTIGISRSFTITDLSGSLEGPWQKPTTPEEIEAATHFVDGWENPLLIQQKMNTDLTTKLGRPVANQLIIRSLGTDDQDLGDDILHALVNNENGAWSWTTAKMISIETNGEWNIELLDVSSDD